MASKLTPKVGDKPKMYGIFKLPVHQSGRRDKGIRTFCKLMNSPPPMDAKSYRKAFTSLYKAYTQAAFESIHTAAEEVQGGPC